MQVVVNVLKIGQDGRKPRSWCRQELFNQDTMMAMVQIALVEDKFMFLTNMFARKSEIDPLDSMHDNQSSYFQNFADWIYKIILYIVVAYILLWKLNYGYHNQAHFH